MPLLPFLLATHIALAVSLLLPSILLPFALRARRAATESASPVVRGLLVLQARGSVVLGLALAVSGVALVPRSASTWRRRRGWSSPWRSTPPTS